MTELTAPELTPEQHDAFLAAITTDKQLGNIAALRKIGLEGHKRDLKTLLTDDLLEEAREARGWSFLKVEAVIWEVAQDKDHPAWQRTSALLAKAYGGPQFRDQTSVELTGAKGAPLEVTVEHDFGRLLTSLEDIGLIRRGPASGLAEAALTESQPVLPARTD